MLCPQVTSYRSRLSLVREGADICELIAQGQAHVLDTSHHVALIANECQRLDVTLSDGAVDLEQTGVRDLSFAVGADLDDFGSRGEGQVVDLVVEFLWE